MAETAEFLTIDPSLTAELTSSTVQGKAGLYIAVSNDVDPVGEALFWSSDQYVWDFTPQSPGTYLVSIPSVDAYWYGDSSLDNLLNIKAGRDATENQIFFNAILQ
ncbi:hypothetical protein F5887DRAFT_1077237 [Amanita rubescens]|nr:hypothetical protein F5887DRAFT_1077237 [Amanita rubescens]